VAIVWDRRTRRAWDRATGYHMTNRNKLGIALNLADQRGKDVFFKLVAKSDGLIIGYSAVRSRAWDSTTRSSSSTSVTWR
jgi:crotonobetainyl-CoA:carnitine CoA-transferase CaiB-like acyl-CoA transferase